MAKNLVFDFGAVLLPINEEYTHEAFKKLGAKPSLAKQGDLFKAFETGQITTNKFLGKLQAHFFRTKIFKQDLAAAWNAMCHAPIPPETIKFLKALKRQGHSLYLLSNTNALHVEKIRKSTGLFGYKQFTSMFNEVFYSHEMGQRKPNEAIYKTVANKHSLEPSNTWFVDDKKKNLKAPTKMGWQTFHFKPEEHSLATLTKAIKKLG